MEQDILAMEKMIVTLLKVVSTMRKKQMGKKSDLAKNILGKDKINILLQSTHQSDHLMSEIENLLNSCLSNSFYIQRQLELRSYRSS